MLPKSILSGSLWGLILWQASLRDLKSLENSSESDSKQAYGTHCILFLFVGESNECNFNGDTETIFLVWIPYVLICSFTFLVGLIGGLWGHLPLNRLT